MGYVLQLLGFVVFVFFIALICRMILDWVQMFSRDWRPRGVVLLAAGQRGTACVDYTPQQVKAAVCGSGRAGKDQVTRMVQALLALPEPPTPDHAADALAVAICHANRAPLAAASARAALAVTA